MDPLLVPMVSSSPWYDLLGPPSARVCGNGEPLIIDDFDDGQVREAIFEF